MKQARYRKSLLIAAVLAAMTAGGANASVMDSDNVPASWLPPSLRLVGVWDVNVTLRDCVSGNAKVTFPAMNQYGADGSRTEFGANTAPSLRYPSLGRWHYAGSHKYRSAFSFFRFNPDGSYAGTQEVQNTIVLSNDANQFTSTATVAIYNPQHQLLASGCATEAGTRR